MERLCRLNPPLRLTDGGIVCARSTDDHYPKIVWVQRSGEGPEETRALLAVEIGQNRFDRRRRRVCDRLMEMSLHVSAETHN